MCGIAGIARQAEPLGPGAAQMVRAMAEVMRHRGPDGTGEWIEGSVALSHRRLAILDLGSGGSQPMVSRSERYVVSYNGEIYNFRELTERLRGEGWRNRTTSDTEVLLAAVEHWGLQGFLDVADGMFAFALFDRAESHLYLVRDPFGEKPLVWAASGREVHFASDIRALRVSLGDLEMSESALRDYFRFGFVPGESTIFTQIRRVAPATYLDFDLRTTAPPEVVHYWQPPEWSVTKEPASEDLLLDLLQASVDRRMIADRPLGAFLSGGIDSSLVCALAARRATGPIRTYTMGWEDAEFDESAQAARVASELGATHHDVRLSRSDVVEEARRLGSVMDEPFADSSLLATRLVAKAARSDVVVSLSGDGGDELFGGYNRHSWLLKVAAARRAVPGWSRRALSGGLRGSAPLLESLTKPIPPTRRPRLVADKARKLAGALRADTSVDAYQAVLTQLPEVGSARVLPDTVLEAMDSGDRDRVLWAIRVADMVGYLCDDVLTKVDRATMSVSLESRTPFLDRSVAMWALGQTADSLIGPDGGKMPLRRLLHGLLPSVSFDQPKAGFGVPVADLLRKELFSDLDEACLAHRDLLAADGVDWRSMLGRLRGGDDRVAAPLWSLLMYSYWKDSSTAPSSPSGLGSPDPA